MSVAIVVLLITFLALQFAATSLDISKNSYMKEDLMRALESANQNALYEIQEKYDVYDTITTPEMLENWLINFCNNNSVKYDQIKVAFVMIETEPTPLYLATIEGYNDFIVLNKDVVEYWNGAILFPKETSEEE